MNPGFFPLFFFLKARWGWRAISALPISSAVVTTTGLTCGHLSPLRSSVYLPRLTRPPCWLSLKVLPIKKQLEKGHLSWDLGFILHPTTILGFQIPEGGVGWSHTFTSWITTLLLSSFFHHLLFLPLYLHHHLLWLVLPPIHPRKNILPP